MSYHNFKLLKKHLLNSSDCSGFLRCLVNELEFPSNIKNAIISNLSYIEWENMSKITAFYIQGSLAELDTIATRPETIPQLPENGFSGIYLCLWEDASALCISGSLYFDEEDWAANADYYTESCTLYKYIEKIRNKIDDILVDIIEEKYIQYLMYCYIAYTCYRFLPTLNLGKNFKNTGFGMGYSDGYEMLLGAFHEGSFVINMKDIDTDGYKKSF